MKNAEKNLCMIMLVFLSSIFFSGCLDDTDDYGAEDFWQDSIAFQIEPDNEDVVKLRQEILGNYSDGNLTYEDINLTHQWIADNTFFRVIEDEQNVSEFIESKRGDCFDRTILLQSILLPEVKGSNYSMYFSVFVVEEYEGVLHCNTVIVLNESTIIEDYTLLQDEGIITSNNHSEFEARINDMLTNHGGTLEIWGLLSDEECIEFLSNDDFVDMLMEG